MGFSVFSLPPHTFIFRPVRFHLFSLLFVPPLFPASGRSSLFPFEDGFLDDGHGDQPLTPGLSSPNRCQNGERMERYSRKVFVGGLPPDIDEGTRVILFFKALPKILLSFIHFHVVQNRFKTLFFCGTQKDI